MCKCGDCKSYAGVSHATGNCQLKPPILVGGGVKGTAVDQWVQPTVFADGSCMEGAEDKARIKAREDAKAKKEQEAADKAEKGERVRQANIDGGKLIADAQTKAHADIEAAKAKGAEGIEAAKGGDAKTKKAADLAAKKLLGDAETKASTAVEAAKDAADKLIKEVQS